MKIEEVEFKITGVGCWEKTTDNKIILLLLESQEIRKESIRWIGCKKDFGETEDLLHLMDGYFPQKCKFLKTLEDGYWTQLGLDQIGKKEKDKQEVSRLKYFHLKLVNKTPTYLKKGSGYYGLNKFHRVFLAAKQALSFYLDVVHDVFLIYP